MHELYSSACSHKSTSRQKCFAAQDMGRGVAEAEGTSLASSVGRVGTGQGTAPAAAVAARVGTRSGCDMRAGSICKAM